MTQNIIDVVTPVGKGTPQAPSMYLLIPARLRDKRRFTEDTSFLVIEAENGDIIYRQQGAV